MHPTGILSCFFFLKFCHFKFFEFIEKKAFRLKASCPLSSLGGGMYGEVPI